MTAWTSSLLDHRDISSTYSSPLVARTNVDSILPQQIGPVFMMIGNSAWDYIFIRSCIFFLHSIAPLSILYCAVVLAIQPATYRIPLFLEAWLIAETLFYIVVYLPRNYALQHAATHPSPASRERRRELFELCHENVSDPERYLSMWFKGAATYDIRRENMKEFFCWAFLNKAEYGPEDDEELEEYVDKLEGLLGRKIEPGRGTAAPLRLTLDKVDMLHRSLIWYLVGWSKTFQ